MKACARTCKYLDSHSWRVQKRISEIYLISVLGNEQVLKKTKKTFENTKLFGSSEQFLKFILSRAARLPSIKLTNLNLDCFDTLWPTLFVGLEQEIKSICLMIRGDSLNIRSTANALRTMLPHTKLFLRILTNDALQSEFDDFTIVELFITSCNVQKEISNVRKLNWPFPDDTLLNFNGLKEFKTNTDDLQLLEACIGKNASTLTRLSLKNITSWNYIFPVQLDELELRDCRCAGKLLQNQLNLRVLKLHETNLTNALLKTLPQNRHLRKLCFYSCKLKASVFDFSFLQNISRVVIMCHLDVHLFHKIFCKVRNNTVLRVAGNFYDGYEEYLDSLKMKVMSQDFLKLVREELAKSKFTEEGRANVNLLPLFRYFTRYLISQMNLQINVKMVKQGNTFKTF